MKTALQSTVLRPLPLRSIRPEGWLRNQLLIQAEGLSGNLDLMWPDIRDSRWFGGTAEGWERAPYWLDGFIPLAFLLDDKELMDRATQHVDHILRHQDSDGWLGPREMVANAGTGPAPHYDLWAQLLAMKMLLVYHDAAGDDRALEAVRKGLSGLDRHIDRSPLHNWGQFRWFEALIPLYRLYERAPEQWLLDLAVKLRAQGFDWGAFFERWPLVKPMEKGRWSYMSHVVNTAMAVKSGALLWRMTGEDADLATPDAMLEKLDRHHGMATGLFTGDECLAGPRPTQGTELCAVVEYAYSLETLLALTGGIRYADRLERIIYNALPGTFSPDMWTHQYDQQANQIECSVRSNRTWTTNGDDANVFGVEPGYGCCTANLSQGWPKFAAHLVMRTADGGLCIPAYGPCTVTTEIAGAAVQLSVETGYPFRDDVKIHVHSSAPVDFPLRLRVPEWAVDPFVSVKGCAQAGVRPGTFFSVRREWSGEADVELRIPASPALWRGFRRSAAVVRGPLVYSLRIAEDWRTKQGEDEPWSTKEVYAKSDWNYALDVTEGTIGEDVIFEEHPVGDRPFSPEGAPVVARIRGKKVPDWTGANGSADDIPAGPVESDRSYEELELIPYGSSTLRITEFPLLRRR